MYGALALAMAQQVVVAPANATLGQTLAALAATAVGPVELVLGTPHSSDATHCPTSRFAPAASRNVSLVLRDGALRCLALETMHVRTIALRNVTISGQSAANSNITEFVCTDNRPTGCAALAVAAADANAIRFAGVRVANVRVTLPRLADKTLRVILYLFIF